MTARVSPTSAGRMTGANIVAVPGRIDRYPQRPDEKRLTTRFAFEEPVILETDRGALIGAVVFNYGRYGLYFETNIPVAAGTLLNIRNESALSTTCRGGCAARVRWTRKIKGRNDECKYGAGAQYF